MLKLIPTQMVVITALATALVGGNADPAAAIGVVGHGTYFGKYHNPLQAGVPQAYNLAPTYAPQPAPVYAAPAPVYAAPAPVYAPQCAPVCNPYPAPCDPCGAPVCYRPVAPVVAYRPISPAPVYAVPTSPRYPTITGGYPQMPAAAYRVPVGRPAASYWP